MSMTFKTSREFPVQPEIIFDAIKKTERLARWWGPAGFTNTFSQFNFVPQGKWSFIMHGPDGTNYPNESEFFEIVPNEKVVIRHQCEPFFTLTIQITRSAKGSTVHWLQEFDNENIAKSVAHIVEPANEHNLDRLMNEVNNFT